MQIFRGESIFIDEDDENDEDEVLVPSQQLVVATPVPTTTSPTTEHPQASTSSVNIENQEEDEVSEVTAPLHIQRRHPPQQMIGNLHDRVTRSRFNDPNSFAYSTCVASFEPKDISHALTDESWINAMHEELENFERNKVWKLVPPPPNNSIIGTK